MQLAAAFESAVKGLVASLCDLECRGQRLESLDKKIQRDDLAPARAFLNLGPRSQVLVINTEGATDPDNHARIVGEAAP